MSETELEAELAQLKADATRHGLIDERHGIIGFHNEMSRVMFRAGLLACREYMARFVESENKGIACSIRANWWPSLGKDPGMPRLNRFDEWYEGEYPDGKTIDIDASAEALPYALQFLLMSRDPSGTAREPENEACDTSE